MRWNRSLGVRLNNTTLMSHLARSLIQAHASTFPATKLFTQSYPFPSLGIILDIKMPTSLEARLQRLQLAGAQPLVKDGNNGSDIPYYEQEIIDHRNQQEAAAEEFRQRQNPTKSVTSKLSNHMPKQTSQLVKDQDHVPGSDPNKPLFLPQGVFAGGLSATKLEDQEDEMKNPGPVSSSQDLVGRYCVWSAVTKFPYKYMQDPNSAVSGMFFAGGKIFSRNWNM